MSLINLLEETKRALESNGKKESDVSWVGSHDGHYRITWEEFATETDKISYNPYSSDGWVIAKDLVIVGRLSWWLSRRCSFRNGDYYDTSTEERWAFNTSPVAWHNATKITIFTTFVGCEGETLKALNEHSPPPTTWQLSQGGEVQISGVHTDGWER